MVKYKITGADRMEKDKKENVQWQAALNPLSLPLLFSGALSMCYLAFNISPSPRICCSPFVLLHIQVFAGQFCGPESAERGYVSAPLGKGALRAAQASSLLGRIDWGILQVMCFLASQLTSTDYLRSAHSGNMDLEIIGAECRTGKLQVILLFSLELLFKSWDISMLSCGCTWDVYIPSPPKDL